jgi:hypothetical protein
MPAGLVVAAISLRDEKSPEIKLRVKYFLMAGTPAVVLGIVQLLSNFGVAIPPVGNFGCIAFIFVTAYAAVRHRLMEIDVLAIRAAGWLFSLIAVIVPVAAIIVWAGRWQLGEDNWSLVFAAIGVVLVGIAAFDRVRAGVESIIERSMFPAPDAREVQP